MLYQYIDTFIFINIDEPEIQLPSAVPHHLKKDVLCSVTFNK